MLALRPSHKVLARLAIVALAVILAYVLVSVTKIPESLFPAFHPSAAEPLRTCGASGPTVSTHELHVDQPARSKGGLKSKPVRNIALQPSTYEDTLHHFVLFLGHARSGSSIIGAVLDAHPHILLSHEYNLLNKMASTRSSSKALTKKSYLLSELYRNQLSKLTGNRSRGVNSSEKGYSLAIKGSFQGQLDGWIGIAGEKSAGKTTHVYMTRPERFVEIIHSIEDTSGVPVKFIQSIRNPFDIIATKAMYRQGGSSLRAELRNGSHTELSVSEATVDCIIEKHIREVKALEVFQASDQFPVHKVYNEDLVVQPKEVFANLCEFLNMDCTLGYVDRCAAAIFSSESLSRYLLKWNQRQIDRVLYLIRTTNSLRAQYALQF